MRSSGQLQTKKQDRELDSEYERKEHKSQKKQDNDTARSARSANTNPGEGPSQAKGLEVRGTQMELVSESPAARLSPAARRSPVSESPAAREDFSKKDDSDDGFDLYDGDDDDDDAGIMPADPNDLKIQKMKALAKNVIKVTSCLAIDTRYMIKCFKDFFAIISDTDSSKERVIYDITMVLSKDYYLGISPSTPFT